MDFWYQHKKIQRNWSDPFNLEKNNLNSINIEISLIEFKLLMTFPSLLSTVYIIIGGYKLYSLWFGRSKTPYKKRKNDITQLIGSGYA